MKRIFTFGLMLASALALTNCTEELVDTTVPTDQVVEEQVTGIPFHVYASVGVDTKTLGYIDNVDGKLKTKWADKDQITVFYAEVTSVGDDGTENLGKMTNAGLFNVTNTNTGEFSGTLPDDFDVSKIYNWYFVYGATSTDVNNNTATVSIGSASIEKEAGAVDHISGTTCPMYGTANRISGTIEPKIVMRHLANLIEVKVENATNYNSVSDAVPGDVVIYDVGISYSTAGNWAKTEALMGSFTLNLLNGSLTKTTTVTNSMTWTLKNKITLGSKYDNNTSYPTSSTFYFVTAPMDLQTAKVIDYYYLTTDKTKTLTVAEYEQKSDTEKKKYTPVIKRQDVFSFSVNGSVRPMPETQYPGNDGDEFASGYMQKFVLPIKEIQYPLESDAFQIYSYGRKPGWYENVGTEQEPKYEWREDTEKEECQVLSFGGYSTPTITINGTVRNDIYVVGGEKTEGTITLQGYAKELINALPVGFYASRGDAATAMTVDHINLWIPTYDSEGEAGKRVYNYNRMTDRTSLRNYTLQDVPYRLLFWDSYADVDMWLAETILGSLEQGITRELMVGDVVGINENTITFNGMVQNGYFAKEDKNAVVLYEAPVYKEVSIQTVEGFINRFSSGGKTATLAGLKAILNATLLANGTLEFKEADGYSATENQSMATETAEAIINKLISVIGDRNLNIIVAEVNFSKIISPGMFKNATDLMHKLRDMKFEIVIKTWPYSSSSTLQPIVFWGLDAWGPNDETRPPLPTDGN